MIGQINTPVQIQLLDALADDNDLVPDEAAAQL